MKLMQDYSHPKYKGLYEEILKDSNFSYGKFSPIPYPQHHEQTTTNRKTSSTEYRFIRSN